MERHLRLVVSLVVGLLLPATFGLLGCRPGSDTSSGSTGSSSLVTVISRPVDLTWIPAESPTSEDEARIADTLQSHNLRFLLPSAAPVPDPASVSAQFIVWETVPTRQVTLELIVRRDEDANPLIAVQSWMGDPSQGVGESQAVRIRGQAGQARVSPGAASMLDWVEGSQNYHAEWVGLPLDQMIVWLESWRAFPTDTASASFNKSDLPVAQSGDGHAQPFFTEHERSAIDGSGPG